VAVRRTAERRRTAIEHVRNGRLAGGCLGHKRRSEKFISSRLQSLCEQPLLAQLDRAPGFEPGGWGFKSLGAGQHLEGRQEEPMDTAQVREAFALRESVRRTSRARRQASG
jgi:hypothetical protein